MLKNKHHFKTATELYADSICAIIPKNNPHKIDTFWEAYNSSRCKTAMLIISILLIAGFIIAELLSIDTKISTYIIIILGYWMGRTSKAKENQQPERITNE